MRADNVPMLRKDGTVFYADMTRNVLQYRGRHCIIGFFRDITERKEAAEALRHEHDVLRQLLRSQDRDRQIIAYEIHDGVAQLLAAAIMQFETYESMRATRRRPRRTAARRGRLAASVSCGSAASDQRPAASILDANGVVAALQHLVYESIATGRN